MTLTEIASPGVSHPGEREPVGPFGTIRELGSDDVQQFISGDVAARCFGVEPGGKFFNGDRHHTSLGSPPVLLLAFEPTTFGTRHQRLLRRWDRCDRWPCLRFDDTDTVMEFSQLVGEAVAFGGQFGVA